MTNISKLDISEYLDSDEMIAGVLAAVLEESDDVDTFLHALSHVAKAKGMAQIAKDSGLSRESLYKSLREGSHPRYETIQKILSALGVTLTVTAKNSASQTQAA